MSNCSICDEKYNKTKRCKVICQCNFEACRACIKKYLLDQTAVAHCMDCKIEWPRKFLSDNFEKVWMNKDYKNHREAILYERELSMMPETQPYVERQITIEKLIDEIDEIKTSISKVYDEYEEIIETVRDNRRKVLKPLEETRYKLEKEINNISGSKNTIVKREFIIRQCPANECRGFLSTALKCGICSTHACVKCHEIKEEEHICDVQILENIKSMEKNTKPCPKCSVKIFKIDGCNLMYCLPSSGGCGIAFDWRTLKIETGTNHNPHYHEYMRQQRGNGHIPRAPGDVICGRELDNHFADSIRRFFSDDMQNILRYVQHARLLIQPQFRPVEPQIANLDLRIQFMRKKIDVEHLKNFIQRHDKDFQKKTELTEVINMFIQCMTDIFYRLKDETSSKFPSNFNGNYVVGQRQTERKIIKETEENIFIELHNLRNYTNSCLLDISKSYNSKKYKFAENFSFI